jgi:hypothetical protein
MYCSAQTTSTREDELTSSSNLPIGGLVLALLFAFLKVPGTRNANRKLSTSEKLKRLDPFGCLVFLGAVTCLLLALQWGGQTMPWESATVIGLFVGFGGLACVFCYIEWKQQEQATIPLRVLFKRSVWTSAIVLFFLSGVTYLVSETRT